MTSTHPDSRHARSRYRLLEVRSTERITPRVVRVTLGGDELADFVDNGTDQRVKLCLPRPGQPTPLGRSRAEVFALPREQQPLQRTYTVRRFDPRRRELVVDLVAHEHGGPGAAWTERVRAGDQVVAVGPSPSYAPPPDANPLVLVGDDTALPAIAATLEALPATASARVFAEVADAAERQRIETAAEVEWTWLHRDGTPAGTSTLLAETVRAADLGPHPHVWIGAEAATVRDLHEHFRGEHGLERSRVHALAYWRRTG
ncbi:NADPH-dependent ferric siderophore reductase [Saccharopolyspora lacisalsi]|uniref:NADPH-dependent ferric siderophore reductase n=1 Tax=Halosaccharopolyspora lacisalsi TaxID=1000566 RepID=A0A839E2A3_9PSEU|nr:siderophore-interacting protein [Halosaccharopolyspora lacisalsi]MBA8827393.1 NADPH-dependent ferric siderophore reductase [Halosaccharopolyspora lacisalsi]